MRALAVLLALPLAWCTTTVESHSDPVAPAKDSTQTVHEEEEEEHPPREDTAATVEEDERPEIRLRPGPESETFWEEDSQAVIGENPRIRVPEDWTLVLFQNPRPLQFSGVSVRTPSRVELRDPVVIEREQEDLLGLIAHKKGDFVFLLIPAQRVDSLIKETEFTTADRFRLAQLSRRRQRLLLVNIASDGRGVVVVRVESDPLESGQVGEFYRASIQGLTATHE